MLDAAGHVVHGGPAGDERARPVRADFSTSINAYGPADVVVEAIRAATTAGQLAAYPDPTCGLAREVLAGHVGVLPTAIAVGAGAAELILALTLAFVRSGERVLVPRHAFGEYARAATICGGPVLTPAVGESLAEAVRAQRPRLVFGCTPESPTGQAWSPTAVHELADACVHVGALLVLDQSYDAFLPPSQQLGTRIARERPDVLCLHSLTKEHALAGVRVGYVAGTPATIAAVERVRMPWSVSTAAQAAIPAAYTPAARAHVARTTAALRAAALAMRTAWGARCTVPSDVHYFLVDVGDARRVTEHLRDRHALRVRDCASFGLPAHVRVAARTPVENALLVAALADVLPDVRPDAPFDAPPVLGDAPHSSLSSLPDRG